MALELDVRTDADGVLWVFHDPGTFRATGVVGQIAEMTTPQVRRLTYTTGRAPLLTLDEAMDIFDAHPTTQVYIEPKDAEVAESVAQVVIERERIENTWLTGKTSKVRRAHPEIRVLQKLAANTDPEPGLVVASGVDAVALARRALTVENVDRYRAAGLVVQSRNTRVTKVWRRGIVAGVDGQLTDFPLSLRRFCPYALSPPVINRARSTRREGVTRIVIRGTAFYDTSLVRLGRRAVPFTIAGGNRIVVRTERRVLRGMRVKVRTPNGLTGRVVSRA